MSKKPPTITVITVKPEFQKLSEDDVARALGSDEETPVVEELARLLDEYSRACSELIRAGREPDEILRKPPTCPLEKIALELVAEAVDTAVDEHIERGRQKAEHKSNGGNGAGDDTGEE
jgi:hypothetical protein